MRIYVYVCIYRHVCSTLVRTASQHLARDLFAAYTYLSWTLTWNSILLMRENSGTKGLQKSLHNPEVDLINHDNTAEWCMHI